MVIKILMKIEYCKNCFYFRKFIMFIDKCRNTGVPLYNRSNTRCKGGYAFKRKMVYVCDSQCNEIEKIAYCLKPIVKSISNQQIDITQILINEIPKLINND